ncbi:MAG: sensor histidine kinase [Ramlibacter sp.]
MTQQSAGRRAPVERQHQRRDVLLATVAHELRNEIGPLGNALELLAHSDDATVRSLAAAMARRQLSAMTHLVEDLTDFGQASRGGAALQRRPLDVQELVRQTVQACRPLFDERRQHVHLDLPGTALTVSADWMRLWQVFVNLLNNAAKFTRPEGHVWISAAREGGSARVCVADDGVGIAPEDLKRIFHLFQQGGGGSRQLSPRGLGIGLAVVRRFVQLHGGTVDAASPGVDQGATFTVRLLLADAA